MNEASRYIYDQAFEDEKLRVLSLSSIHDPGSRRVLSAVGLALGWTRLA